MLGKLIDKIRTNIAVRELNQLPAVKYGRLAIEKYWTGNHEITKDFSDRLVKTEAEEMMKEVIEVATSPDPRMANRQKLTNCVIEYARFQVLVIDPVPAPDPTGFRSEPGITGELKAHLFELAQKEEKLREFMHGFDTPKVWDDVWNPVLLRYRQLFAWTHVFNTLRLAFDDTNDAQGKEWFKPFIAATCAWEEHQYRKSLGMPPVLDKPGIYADAKAIGMGSFMNFVMSGARYPDLEWRDGMRKLERGGIESGI